MKQSEFLRYLNMDLDEHRRRRSQAVLAAMKLLVVKLDCKYMLTAISIESTLFYAMILLHAKLSSVLRNLRNYLKTI